MSQEISHDNRNLIVERRKNAFPWSEIPSRLLGHIPITAIESPSNLCDSLLEQCMHFNFLLSDGK